MMGEVGWNIENLFFMVVKEKEKRTGIERIVMWDWEYYGIGVECFLERSYFVFV